MSKANDRLQLSLDPARLNKVLIRLMHIGPTLNDIVPRLVGIKYLILIDASLEYHNLKLDEKSSYLTTFSCLFGRYRYIQLLFGVVPADKIFQKKIDELVQGLSNIFGITDDILIAELNDLCRNMTRQGVKICRKASMKPSKENASSGVPTSPTSEKSYHSMIWVQILKKSRQ